MTLREVTEQIISAVNAASPTLGMKWKPRAVEAIVPSLREQALQITYNGSRERGANKRINGAIVQRFEVTIDPSIQDSDVEYLIANIPNPVSLSERMNGFIYFGSKDRTNRFFQAQSRDEIATLKDRGFINNGVHTVFMVSGGQVEIFGNKSLKNAYVEMIAADPILVPNFNIETDQYPVNDELLLTMIDLFKRTNSISVQQPQDNVADAADTTVIQAINRNII